MKPLQGNMQKDHSSDQGLKARLCVSRVSHGLVTVYVSIALALYR